MSKFNILEFHKNMKSSLKGAVEKAEQRSAEAKQRLRDIKQLEADMLKRLEAKREKESEAVAEQPATVQEPVVKQPAVKTEKPAAEVVKPEQPVKVKTEEKKDFLLICNPALLFSTLIHLIIFLYSKRQRNYRWHE